MKIFGNLLDNAFKFACSRGACSARQDGRRAWVEIADDGPGLDEEQVALVLQPGRRLDERVPGFGFGLTITRELVELYGGEMRFSTATSGLIAIEIRFHRPS